MNTATSRRLLVKPRPKEVRLVKKIAIRDVETLKTTAALYDDCCWNS
jgi:hypothetical protein